MAPDLASSLAQSQRRTIELALEQVERSTGAVQTWWLWSQRLEAAMEALSRFILRLKPVEVESVLQLARSLYCNPRIHSRIQYYEPLANLFRRSWEALSGSLQTQHALDLLRLPIVGVDGFTVDMENHFRDPGYILDAANSVRGVPAPARSEENESAWVEVVGLVDKGLKTSGAGRKRAAVRLAVLSRWQRLTPEERQRLAGALWEFGLDCDGLPRDADLHPWVFLELPELEPGLAESRLRAAWVKSANREDESRESLEKVLAGAGTALSHLPARGHEITLTNAEVDSLLAAVDRWAAMGPSTILPWNRPHMLQEWRSTLRNVAALLLELEVSPTTAQTLLDTVRKLGTEKTPAYELVPGIVKSDHGLATSASALLRVGLGGSTPEQSEQAASAWGGLYWWLRASALEDSGLPRAPDHLVFEMGEIIAAPRWFVLSQALEIAAWVFEEGIEEHRELLRPPVLSGLDFLRRALVFREISPNPLVEQPQVNEDDVDVPLLRWRCVRLAKAMDSAGFGDEEAVIRWLKDAETDPLPEVLHGGRLGRRPGFGKRSRLRVRKRVDGTGIGLPVSGTAPLSRNHLARASRDIAENWFVVVLVPVLRAAKHHPDSAQLPPTTRQGPRPQTHLHRQRHGPLCGPGTLRPTLLVRREETPPPPGTPRRPLLPSLRLHLGSRGLRARHLPDRPPRRRDDLRTLPHPRPDPGLHKRLGPPGIRIRWWPCRLGKPDENGRT